MRLEATLGDRQRTWQPFAAERAIVVEVDAAPDLAVMATPDHLTQVLDNLIANALDASPDNSTITLSARPGGLTATIHVVDQGPPPHRRAARQGVRSVLESRRIAERIWEHRARALDR